MRPPGEPRGVGYLYLLPAFLLYGGFVLLPLLHGLWLSFFDWNGLTRGTWVGLLNYRDLLTSPEIRSAFLHSLTLIIFYALLPVALGLLLAASVSRVRVRGLAAYRTVLFLPQVMPMVVVALIWRRIYAPEGPLNHGLQAIGLHGLARPWLGDFGLALPAVGLVGTWVLFGLCMVLFIAGVQKIPTSLYDAARVDGAGPIREFRAVTLPGLRGEIVVALTLTIIAALRNFDLIYITTQGGPGDATTVPSFEVYRRAFQTGRVGSAAAIGMTVALVIFAMTFLVTRMAEGKQ
jgi:raffinose/stachyose/melibiose transport system permease protein